MLPSLVMVCNPTVQYVLFEWLLARIREARLKAGRKGSAIAPTGGQVPFAFRVCCVIPTSCLSFHRQGCDEHMAARLTSSASVPASH